MIEDPRAGRLPALLAESEEAYGLTDLHNAKRIGGLACAVGLLIILALLPFDPPTHHLGGAGWLLAGACIVIIGATGARLMRWPEAVTPNELMLLSYLALTIITALEWLGGRRSPYMELFLMPPSPRTACTLPDGSWPTSARLVSPSRCR